MRSTWPIPVLVWNQLASHACIFLGFTPNFSGLIFAVADSTGQHSVHISGGARHLYAIELLFGFVTGAFVYMVASILFPE